MNQLTTGKFISKKRKELNMTQEQLLKSFTAKHTIGKTKYVPRSAPSMVEQNAIYQIGRASCRERV